jgi:hypothetical protein
MSRRKLAVVAVTATMFVLGIAGPATAAPSCTAQFVTVASGEARPLGLNVVRPELRELTFGGRNLGDEVSFLFATADRTACPVTP